MVKETGQCITNFVKRLEMVMKYYHRALPCIFQRDIQTLLPGDLPVEIIGQYRPHNKPVLLPKEPILSRGEPAVRGPEQLGV